MTVTLAEIAPCPLPSTELDIAQYRVMPLVLARQVPSQHISDIATRTPQRPVSNLRGVPHVVCRRICILRESKPIRKLSKYEATPLVSAPGVHVARDFLNELPYQWHTSERGALRIG